MRIGVNCYMLQAHIGGLKQYFLALFEELLASDNKNEYIFFHFAHNQAELEALGNDSWRKRAVLLKAQEDILEHLGKIDLFFCPFGALYPRPVPIPAVVTLVDIQEVFYPQFFTQIDMFNRDYHFRGSARIADRLITISEFSRQTIVKHYGIDPSRIVVSHLTADARYFRVTPSVTVPESLPSDFILYPANRWPHKNHGALLLALQSLKRKGVIVPAVFTGFDMPGGYPLMERAAAYGLEDQVRSLHYVSVEEMICLYSRANLLVFPSLFEGFGIPLVEAMAVGCPVVASRTTSLPEIGADAAEYFDPESPESLGTVIENTWRNQKRRNEMIAAGRRRASAFSAQRMAAMHIRAFEEASQAFSNVRYLWQRCFFQPMHKVYIGARYHKVLAQQASGVVQDGFRVTFSKGWYKREEDAGGWWRWTSGNAYVTIDTPRDGTLQITGEIASIPRPNTVDVLIGGQSVAKCDLSAQRFGFVPLPAISLKCRPGRHSLEFVSACPGRCSPGDKRSLAIAVKNLDVTLIEVPRGTFGESRDCGPDSAP